MHNETIQHKSDACFSVLVVEDEFMIALDLEMALEENGYSVVGPACSNEEALRLLDSTQPDVAVLDVNVRGQLVAPVAERLRSQNIPFVLSSAYTSLDFTGSEVLSDAENVGKPINVHRLVEAVGRAVAAA